METIVSVFVICFYVQCANCFLFLKLLDLFSLENANRTSNGSSSSSTNTRSQSVGPVSIHTMLSTLPDLWEDKQYEEEYDMKTFMKSLKNN